MNFTCKGRSERPKDRYTLCYAMHIDIAKDKPREKKNNTKGKDVEKKQGKKFPRGTRTNGVRNL